MAPARPGEETTMSERTRTRNWRRAAEAYCREQARGLSPGMAVGVEKADGPHVGVVEHDGCLLVEGCLVSGGIIRRLTKPWRPSGRSYTVSLPLKGHVAATLADGREAVWDPSADCPNIFEVVVEGRRYPNVLAAALELTPAEESRP